MSIRKTKLTINFDEKDVAKKYGARWDNEEKCWYMPHFDDYLTRSAVESQNCYESLEAINNIAKELERDVLSIIPQYKEYAPALNTILTRYAWTMSGIENCSDVLYNPKTYEADLRTEYEKVVNYKPTGLYNPQFETNKQKIVKRNFEELLKQFPDKEPLQNLVKSEPNVKIKLDISYLNRQVAKNNGATWDFFNKKWELNKSTEAMLKAIDEISKEIGVDFYEVVNEDEISKVEELVKKLNFSPTNKAPELSVDTPEHRKESFFTEFAYHFKDAQEYFDNNAKYVGDYTKEGFERVINDIYNGALMDLKDSSSQNHVDIDGDHYAVINSGDNFLMSIGSGYLDDVHTNKTVRNIAKLLGYEKNAFVDYIAYEAIMYRESDGKLCLTEIVDINGESIVAKEPRDSWSYEEFNFEDDFGIEINNNEYADYEDEIELD